MKMSCVNYPLQRFFRGFNFMAKDDAVLHLADQIGRRKRRVICPLMDLKEIALGVRDHGQRYPLPDGFGQDECLRYRTADRSHIFFTFRGSELKHSHAVVVIGKRDQLFAFTVAYHSLNAYR